MADLTLSILLIILLAAFTPSLILMLVVKNTEKRGREPTSRTFSAFLRGATLSIFLAIILEMILVYLVFGFDIARISDLLGKYPGLDTLILACIIAPFVEELTKALGMLPFTRRSRELEDGIVYGAVVGLGFAATENLLYETSAWLEGGVSVLIGTIIIRTVSSALLHASASSITGYGLTTKKFLGKSWVPYYLLAVLLHGVFNLAASAGPFLEGSMGDNGYLIGLIVAIAIGVGAFSWSRRKIRAIERKGAA
jgi:protease PrsW